MTIQPLSVNYSKGRFGKSIDKIVLHTMVGNSQSAYARFSNPSQSVSAHYGIELDGTVYQWVSESDTAWQAGNWDVNCSSIGIEHSDNGDYNGPRTDALYEASGKLVADILRRYGLGIENVHIHREFYNTGCPDGLDYERIKALAQNYLLGISKAITAPPLPHEAITSIEGEDVRVTNSVLRVHNDPSTQDAGTFANTTDGMVHAGDTVHIIGWTIGEDPYKDGRDVWLETLNGLGESHWIWAGGTDFVVPVASAPTPVPDPAPAPVVEAPVVVSKEPATPVAAPVAPATPAINESVNGQATLALNAPIRDLLTGTDVGIAKAQSLPVAATAMVGGTLYLLTKNMVAATKEGIFHGIPSTYFAHTTPPVMDSLSTPTPTPQLSDLPKHQGWIARFLHFITKGNK